MGNVNFLNDEDRLEIRDVLDGDAESNNTSAVNWVKYNFNI